MKKWEVLNKLKVPHFAKASRGKQNSKFKTEELIGILLENRGIKTKKEIDEFLNPKLEDVTADSVGIDKKNLKRTIERIKKAISKKEQIIVFGDYDVDGICGTAILWETLSSLGANAMPYIPHRVDEGYGLSVKAIQSSEFMSQKPKLIITVDNGIVANEAVEFANKQGIDVIITDHHVPPADGPKKLPKAYSIVHTTKLCGTGVAYLLAQKIQNSSIRQAQDKIQNSHLELVALATVADLVPLTGANRTLLAYGLRELQKTKRIGLLELFNEAAIDKEKIDPYAIGHVIAPRLNAMGRLEYAMDSLRLLCTNNKKRALDLAQLIGNTNRQRQLLTIETTQHAFAEIKARNSRLRQGFGGQAKLKKLIFISHESYEQGVIGLVAGRLVEEFYKPAIVLSKGEKYSKASARSVSGFNIIEFIRSSSDLLIDAGGHPMAAGFTVETKNLSLLQKKLEDLAEKLLNDGHLTRTLKIDYELDLSLVDKNLYQEIQKLSPFGMKNPEPTFLSKNIIIEDMRIVGRDGKHMKLKVKSQNAKVKIDGIAFGMGERIKEFHVGDSVNIVYTIDNNVWNGNSTLQLKIKDIKN